MKSFMRLGGSVLLAVAVFGSLAHLLRRWLQPTSACQPADRQGKQQHSSSTSKHTALLADESDAAAQQAVIELQRVYASMAAAFSAGGLDLDAIAETAAWFEMGPPAPWPRRYSSFLPHPLPPGSVRLVVVPLADNCPRLASTAAAAAADILGLLPPGRKVFSNARQNLHITVFHFSHPADTRPDSLDACSGLAHCLAAQQGPAAAQQQGSHLQQQQQQQQLGRGDASPPFTLQFERGLLARSGVLLLTWSDPSGALARLRSTLHSSFPGACSKQSSIIHTSLFRILGTPASSPDGAGRPSQQQTSEQEVSAAGAPLSDAAIQSISAACERWTQQLRGTRLAVSSLWWVAEEEFSSIQGQRLPLACCSKTLPN
ncbi:hypothetical protein OEZ85_000427 [Tetradesmus obliquus]|uniref:Protein kinase A anchor protein nuclear localisation signal domain-containing protein n=1 Tax=Tetradesmus obliquus TaxID=3088 RepID=A0ABY8US33_TETOB|nr:hypothetical protein OEZ85_000427 [Tetradesmus obliquus]